MREDLRYSVIVELIGLNNEGRLEVFCLVCDQVLEGKISVFRNPYSNYLYSFLTATTYIMALCEFANYVPCVDLLKQNNFHTCHHKAELLLDEDGSLNRFLIFLPNHTKLPIVVSYDCS